MSAEYHPGEIEIQERAGVRSMAERVGNSIHPTIPPVAREFLEEQLMVVVGSVGADGRVWASLLAGEPGFVRLLGENVLEFRDYSGNTMFNTLGNIAVNPNAGLLFLDFEGGDTLQLTGEAQIVWEAS